MGTSGLLAEKAARYQLVQIKLAKFHFCGTHPNPKPKSKALLLVVRTAL